MNKSGFTLVETLVAITILIVGVIGPLAVASRGISDGLFAANQLAANYLAQEAMEVILNQRDTNITAIKLGVPGSDDPDYWLAGGLLDCINSNTTCSVVVGADGTQPAVTADCTESAPCILAYNLASGLYESGAEDAASVVFNRTVSIERVIATNDEVKAKVTVSWQNKTVPRSFTLVEHLFSRPRLP